MFLDKFFKGVGKFFSNIFKGAKKVIQDSVKIGVQITNEIKEFDLAHPLAGDVLGLILPGKLPAAAVNILRNEFPKILAGLRLVDNTLAQTNPNEAIKAAIATLQTLGGDFKANALTGLAAIITRITADGKIDINMATHLVITWYKEQGTLIEAAQKEIDDAKRAAAENQ